MIDAPANPFAIRIHRSDTAAGRVIDSARALVERVLGLDGVGAIYERARSAPADVSFLDAVLSAMELGIRVDPAALERIPRTGPLVVVANHPMGGAEGLALAAILRRVRPDVKLVANYLLGRIPELRDMLFLVDPFGGAAAIHRNIAAMKSAMRWLDDGHVLGAFPAGEVSHLRLGERCVTDPPWSDSIARIVQHARAPVLPVLFEGCNSRLFQVAGLLHPRLRTALLPRELLNRRQTTVSARIGSLISYARLNQFADPASMTRYLRVRTYILRGRATPAATPARRVQPPAEPIADPQPASAIAAEIAALPREQMLVQTSDLSVLIAQAAQVPAALREIGRLREMTFRQAGEGTGRSIDLDRFDAHYQHLFVWKLSTREIVGAYRLGATDDILPRHGLRGLYTNTLFRYKRRLLHEIGPAIELGRSFVVPAHQKSYLPLMLLWRGIGRFVAAHPRYRHLFGAVSISDEYQSMTKQLLVGFLRANDYACPLGRLVQPRNPPQTGRFRDCSAKAVATVVRSVSDVEELVGEIESDRREMPVLLRQYLKLNAKLLGFNIDPDFGDVLDGLMLVDLTQVERPVLNRYLGREETNAFMKYHRTKTEEA